MEAATKERELSGEKAQRIVDAMRDSVAKRGAAGSTFEQVAREAGVSRGLLHYYFGTKERLLVEVVRRDAEIQREVGQLFERTRSHVAEVLEAKQGEGVLSLRYDAQAIVSYLFALGDGFALQALSDPDQDIDAALEAGTASARFLLSE